MKLWNLSIPNPVNQARYESLGGGSDSNSNNKNIEAEDVRDITPFGWLDTMESAPTLNAASPMKLQNQSILNPGNQARSGSLGGGADYDSDSKDINIKDVGAMTPYGWLACMDSAPTPYATSPMNLWNHPISNPKNHENFTTSLNLCCFHLKIVISVCLPLMVCKILIESYFQVWW